MTVLLRHKETKLYLGRAGHWVAGTSLATQFPTVNEALLFNRQKQLKQMEVVLLHSNERNRTVLPISNQTWARADWGFLLPATQPVRQMPRQARAA